MFLPCCDSSMIRRLFSLEAGVSPTSLCRFLVLGTALFLSHQAMSQDSADTATTISVPGVWENQAGGQFADLDGFAWYRCDVKVPERWTPKSRSLYGDSVTITVEHVANAFELFVNGQKVG